MPLSIFQDEALKQLDLLMIRLHKLDKEVSAFLILCFTFCFVIKLTLYSPTTIKYVFVGWKRGE